MTITHHVGDVLDVVATLPDASVDLVATSPPFLALRDYNGIDGQWGSEPTPAAFLDHLLELAVELRRVLAPHGSIAVELGDTYSGSGGAGGDYDPGGLRDGQAAFTGSARRDRGVGWPLPKSLTGVPTLFAWSLAYGRNLLNPGHEFERWRVRNVIVWARRNPPVGALGDKVRPATSYITVATPSARRWFDLDAVRVNSKKGHASINDGGKYGPSIAKGANNSRRDLGVGHFGCDPAGAPPLDHWHDEYDGDLTWLINTQGSSLAHYAMWPPKLAERLVLSMCPAEVCRTCGEPRRRVTGPVEYVTQDGVVVDDLDEEWRHGRRGPLGRSMTAAGGISRSATTLGWSDCGHDNYRPGVVLDPFAGSGTTLFAAEACGRDAIGIDLDSANVQLHERRRDEVRRSLLGERPQIPGQLTLIDDQDD